jgi:SDR family mycofactocin-dependent oxidoreductase
VALVTGAARGIGAATVHRLCAEGYHVVAVDSCGEGVDTPPAGVTYPLATRADLDELASAHPGAVIAIVADVRDPSALRTAASRAVAEFGGLDVAVAAAAVIVGGEPLWATPPEHLRTLIDVDVVGVWNTAAVVVPHMLASDEPSACRFVAVASAAGSYGLFRLAAYNVAKHAVVGLVRGLAADLVGTGVTAVAVSPGSTETAMLRATADLYGLADTGALAESTPLRRILHPDEIAATIAFACSREGSVLNGSVIEATGGFRG